MILPNQYRVVHVTNEILNHFVGGICTVLNSLYENKEKDELFILIKDNEKDDQKSENLVQYDFDTFKDLKKLPLNQEPEVIFYHSFNCLYESKLKTSAKKGIDTAAII